ncbi:MAG: hypothetical protein F4X65_13925 [Chloroflexi bacterium]|nr:hypothetical protein [Chloroflexota bacterium]
MSQRRPVGARDLTLAWDLLEGKPTLRISGWDANDLSTMEELDAGEFSRRLAVVTTEAAEAAPDLADNDQLPRVAGSFRIAGDSVFFVPRFPFVEGMSYSLLLYGTPSSGHARVPEVRNIRRPSREVPPTARVEAIYPDVSSVPVNLLKIYVQFSESMSEGRAERSIRVYREDTGEPLEGVFVPLDPELWDPERKRLTLLLDPARIKHGLVPNMEAGYPLIEGVPFRLVIGSEFRNAAGSPMLSCAERVYQVGPEVSERLIPNRWQLTVPPVGSRDPLLVEFDRPLDYALLQRSLWIEGPQGNPVAGGARSGNGESSWTFAPDLPWTEGPYRLVVAPELEDLAGNSPVRVFDRDITQSESASALADGVSLSFHCSGRRQDSGRGQ